MDYQRFYSQLFAPLEASLGPIDRDTIVALIGFDAGGPLNFCTIAAERADRFITYVSCELAVRPEQQPSEFGRYELLATCNDERWVRSILTKIGRMSTDVAFGHHHTLDVGGCVQPGDVIQGVVFEEVYETEIDGVNYGVLRCLGITRPEMEYAQEHGPSNLLSLLKRSQVYPCTNVTRKSVL